MIGGPSAASAGGVSDRSRTKPILARSLQFDEITKVLVGGDENYLISAGSTNPIPVASSLFCHFHHPRGQRLIGDHSAYNQRADGCRDGSTAVAAHIGGVVGDFVPVIAANIVGEGHRRNLGGLAVVADALEVVGSSGATGK